MKLTTKGRYAVTAAVDLAMHATDGPVTLSDIAERQSISLSYLEQLFARLRKGGLVESVRGPGGGYLLGREASAIRVADVIAAVNENTDTTACGGAHNCRDNGECLTHELWTDLGNHIYQYLNSVTLSDLVEQNSRRKDQGVVPNEAGCVTAEPPSLTQRF